MLYRTTPFSFSFPSCNPFSSPPPSKFSSSFSLSSPLQVEKEMECIVKGGSFGLKKNHQQQMMFLEDFCSNFSNPLNNTTTYTINNVASSTTSTPTSTSIAGEDFFVDQLLNLNNGDEDDEFDQQLINNNNNSTSVVKKEDQFEEQVDNQTLNSKKLSSFLSPPLDYVLSVPAEEADLEWLSEFVEESFSQVSTPYPLGYVKPKPKPKPEFLPEGAFFAPANLSKSRRSKRARTGGRVWSAALTDPYSPSTSPGYPSTPELGLPKKQKKKDVGPGGGANGPPRRCSHCGVQKTPQWRAGPMGAKTLCNACGVRYKSGRLLPEYRPACSPTFSTALHSNSHRKVLEMRRKKEMVTGQPESGSLSHPVSSFG